MGAKRDDQGGVGGSTSYSFVGERSAKARKRTPSESGDHSVDTSEDGKAARDEVAEAHLALSPELDDDPLSHANADDGDVAHDDGMVADDDESGEHDEHEAAAQDDDSDGAVESADGDEASAGEEGRLPSLDTLEPLVGRGDYEKICELLGPLDRATELPPTLALIFAAAHKEARPTVAGSQVNFLAIRSVATLLGVDEDSRIALALAKRIVRQNPVAGPRPAPPPVARVALIILGLALGIVAGWAAGPGGVQLFEILEAVMR